MYNEYSKEKKKHSIKKIIPEILELIYLVLLNSNNVAFNLYITLLKNMWILEDHAETLAVAAPKLPSSSMAEDVPVPRSKILSWFGSPTCVSFTQGS